MSIKKLRTKRDNQQWMLDLALNMRGRVQNFERDDLETPTRAHNYRMLPKQWRLKGEHDESLGLSAESPIHQVGSLTSHHVARYERILLIIVLNSRLAFR